MELPLPTRHGAWILMAKRARALVVDSGYVAGWRRPLADSPGFLGSSYCASQLRSTPDVLGRRAAHHGDLDQQRHRSTATKSVHCAVASLVVFSLIVGWG